jgi:hypothetical protein
MDFRPDMVGDQPDDALADTSTMEGSRNKSEMAGPSAVRSMRAPRSIVACFRFWLAISSPFPGRRANAVPR